MDARVYVHLAKCRKRPHQTDAPNGIDQDAMHKTGKEPF